jgi:hypothetical protein
MNASIINESNLSKDNHVILIEGDDPNSKTWFMAKRWQREGFSEALRYNTMKTMGYPNDYEISESFKDPLNKFSYRFIIFNDWTPCFMVNTDTKKIREVKYFPTDKSGFTHYNAFNELGITPDCVDAFNLSRR